MADQLLTPSIITNETLAMLENNLVMGGMVNRQFENQFKGIGATITVRKPNRFVLTRGPGLQIQDVIEPSTSITISNQLQVAFKFSLQDLTLIIREFSERYLKPAAAVIANGVDTDVMALVPQIYNQVGTAGTIPNNYSYLTQVGQRMDEGAVPQDGRKLVLGPAAYWSMDNALIGLYVKSVSEPALKGFLANLANFEIYQDQNATFQTTGAYAGTGVVNGAGQTGGTLVTNGWTASTAALFQVGDVITLDGVYAINPQSRVSTQALMNFVINAVAASDSGGNSTISFSPAIVTTGAYQNVSNAPANLTRVRLANSAAASTTYAQSIGFVKDCFGLVTVPLELPDGVDFKAREMYKGLSLRIIRAYDINNDQMPCRLDLLEGVAAFYPELGARLTS